MFWRGSIYPWNQDKTVPVRLGVFQDFFRTYLLGAADFPKDCCLWVNVRKGKEFDRLTYSPVGGRVDNVHIYRFPMPGLAFLLVVSKNIPERLRTGCFVHTPGNPIISTPIIEELLIEEVTRMRNM